MDTSGPSPRGRQRRRQRLWSCLAAYLYLIAAIVSCAVIAFYFGGPIAAVLVFVGLLGACVGIWWYLAFTNWKGIPPKQFTLYNNRESDVVVLRIQPTPGAEHRLQPGERITFTRSDPMFDGVRSRSDRTKSDHPLLLAVRDPSGYNLGWLHLSANVLTGIRGFTVCLAAASDPPYVVETSQDAIRSCPRPYPGSQPPPLT